MYLSRRRHPSGVDLTILAEGEELAPEDELRIWEHLIKCPKCHAEYREAVEFFRAVAPGPPMGAQWTAERRERSWARMDAESSGSP